MASEPERVNAQPVAEKRDNFYWIGQINKASAIINTDEGLLDPTLTPNIASGLQTVLEKGKNGGPRPGRVLDFEPRLIEASSVEATLLHAGRSSQDIHMTATSAQLREETLRLAAQLHDTTQILVQTAEAHVDTLVPNYTNGVAAQPNSYGHYLLGHIAGFSRDADRLREFYTRLDLSPMGTTVLNGTSWPLNRDRMASYLGFPGTVDNAYDAVQIRNSEIPVELGSLGTSICLHIGILIQDIMVQYSQPRPWILLKEGGDATYASSAMPQKRNPGILNNTRTEASRIVTLGVGRTIAAHNVPSGMVDTRPLADNIAVLSGSASALRSLSKVFGALVINPQRSLEELNLDWTASQELADVLMREYKIPFRVGHHFCSDMVGFAREHDIRPSGFPYAEAERLFAQTCVDMKFGGEKLPMSEAQFRTTLDPAAIVRNRATAGGPQPKEMERMLKRANETLAGLEAWIAERTKFIEDAVMRLDVEFSSLLKN